MFYNFGASKRPVEILREGAFWGTYLFWGTFIPVFLESGRKSYGTLFVCKCLKCIFEGAISLIPWFIAVDVTTALCFHGCVVLINMVLNGGHR